MVSIANFARKCLNIIECNQRSVRERKKMPIKMPQDADKIIEDIKEYLLEFSRLVNDKNKCSFIKALITLQERWLTRCQENPNHRREARILEFSIQHIIALLDMGRIKEAKIKLGEVYGNYYS